MGHGFAERERTIVQMPPWSRDLPWCRWRPCQFCGALELKDEDGAAILHERCRRFYRKHKWAVRADRQVDPYNAASVLTLLEGEWQKSQMRGSRSSR